MSLFTRVQSTPILDYTASALLSGTGVNVSNWCSGGLAAPSVCYDPADSSFPYKIAVSGWNSQSSGSGGQKWSTGFFKTLNFQSFTLVPNSIIAPSGNASSGIYIHGNGSLIKIGSTFYHYYVAYNKASQTSQMYVETSSDLVTWTQGNSSNPIITLGSSGSGEDALQYDPQVFYNPTSSKYELWYAATNNADGTRSLFRADSTDGVSFTRQGRQFYQQPWMVGGFGEPCPNMTSAGLKFLTLDAGITSGVRQPGFAQYDGQQWQFTPQCLAYGSGFDTACLFDTCSIITDIGSGTKLYLLYAGATVSSVDDNTQSSIGLAYAPVPTLPSQPVSTSRVIPGQFNAL